LLCKKGFKKENMLYFKKSQLWVVLVIIGEVSFHFSQLMAPDGFGSGSRGGGDDFFGPSSGMGNLMFFDPNREDRGDKNLRFLRNMLKLAELRSKYEEKNANFLETKVDGKCLHEILADPNSAWEGTPVREILADLEAYKKDQRYKDPKYKAILNTKDFLDKWENGLNMMNYAIAEDQAFCKRNKTCLGKMQNAAILAMTGDNPHINSPEGALTYLLIKPLQKSVGEKGALFWNWFFERLHTLCRAVLLKFGFGAILTEQEIELIKVSASNIEQLLKQLAKYAVEAFSSERVFNMRLAAKDHYNFQTGDEAGISEKGLELSESDDAAVASKKPDEEGDAGPIDEKSRLKVKPARKKLDEEEIFECELDILLDINRFALDEVSAYLQRYAKHGRRNSPQARVLVIIKRRFLELNSLFTSAGTIKNIQNDNKRAQSICTAIITSCDQMLKPLVLNTNKPVSKKSSESYDLFGSREDKFA